MVLKQLVYSSFQGTVCPLLLVLVVQGNTCAYGKVEFSNKKKTCSTSNILSCMMWFLDVKVDESRCKHTLQYSVILEQLFHMVTDMAEEI